ncbi:uncharacterized protein L969DRAFT_89376 [Mixia osmundae IAM 14324]|uniref:uncharacterized protein n=1 Tax=Mixia osmundae (strain CBS 9802 / IAM 14324 / JCM 22182 / KY 12970) TaxID=764103 RepID=UPI0004A5520C|nr:uncharacterized protein L969DRAFT_91157 [Mixia osmundae IAM 14324]XP_014566697.1 uncharacterized protein L969DRAFT_89376 [Mixia osmundae IAM 14324]KEI36164.1 hypothetical protein L969DRAFT_91157 [Mixia osmundae IAM 14324]KEI38132.1 hypothetical protein L969DRAFT_89376 [Mixia osmundae IAM 14324]
MPSSSARTGMALDRDSASARPAVQHNSSPVSPSSFVGASLSVDPTAQPQASTSRLSPALVPSTSTPNEVITLPPAKIEPKIIPTRLAKDGIKEVPARFERCELEDLIGLVASMLTRLIEHNDLIPLTPTSLTRFHSRAPPGISVHDYLVRISRYTNVEPCCLLILLHYIDKICESLPAFTISSLTVHRFVIAGVAVGSKALSDSFCTNGRYARVGGVSMQEMNLLEKEFLAVIDWRLTTTGALLSHYYASLVGSHPGYRLMDEEAPTTTAPTLGPTEADDDVHMMAAPPPPETSPNGQSSQSSGSGSASQPSPIERKPRSAQKRTSSALDSRSNSQGRSSSAASTPVSSVFQVAKHLGAKMIHPRHQSASPDSSVS